MNRFDTSNSSLQNKFERVVISFINNESATLSDNHIVLSCRQYSDKDVFL